MSLTIFIPNTEKSRFQLKAIDAMFNASSKTTIIHNQRVTADDQQIRVVYANVGTEPMTSANVFKNFFGKSCD